MNLEEFETISANMCVTEISNELSKLNCEQTDESDVSLPDPSSFVTVIEVNGLKSTATTQTQTPPKYDKVAVGFSFLMTLFQDSS